MLKEAVEQVMRERQELHPGQKNFRKDQSEKQQSQPIQFANISGQDIETKILNGHKVSDIVYALGMNLYGKAAGDENKHNTVKNVAASLVEKARQLQSVGM